METISSLVKFSFDQSKYTTVGMREVAALLFMPITFQREQHSISFLSPVYVDNRNNYRLFFWNLVLLYIDLHRLKKLCLIPATYIFV